MSEYIYETNGEVVQNVLSEVFEPLQEIVRCRDCKNYQPSMYAHFTCECLQIWAKPDDFCAWGKKGLNHER